MRVKARAVIWIDGQLILASQIRRGKPELSLPGGQVKGGESLSEALIREVDEETGLRVRPDRLLYIVELVQSVLIHDLELIFLAHSYGTPRLNHLAVLDLRAGERGMIKPPILDEIAHDDASDYRGNPRWLGNLRRPRPQARQMPEPPPEAGS